MTISLIDALPSFISVADHHALQASTPASFADIPPVLRFQQDNIKVVLEPAITELSTTDLELGTLYISESALFFFSPKSNRGFRVEYPVITLHAISRAASGPSIYCQLDESSRSEDQDITIDDPMREMTLIPQDAGTLEPIFENLSFCASLHPDPEMLDDADEAAWIDGATDLETFEGDEAQELSEVGRAALEHLEAIIEWPQQNGVSKSEEDPQDVTPQPGASTTD